MKYKNKLTEEQTEILIEILSRLKLLEEENKKLKKEVYYLETENKDLKYELKRFLD